MVRRLGLLSVWILVAIMSASSRPRETGFLNRIAQVGGVKYRYQVYVPPEWNGSRKWPIILFLHGAGERGEDGLLQTQVGIATAVRLHADRFPAIIVMPQCRKNVWWAEPAMEAQALKALEQSTKEFKGDPDRTYLTGLSMGGYGTWSIAAKFPARFAALVPICGGVREPRRGGNSPSTGDPYAPVAASIAKTPVWIFHGGDDKTVPVKESREMNRALKAAGADPKYTEYEGVGHNSWDRAYSDSELMPWLLRQRRK
jgi:predicted peptidase